MKNLIIIILAIHCSLFPSISFSQPCLPDGITFTTQSEIDNFQTNYPNCTEIGGDVIIFGGYIANLNGLSVLTSIEGSLRIGGWDEGSALINLTGLEGLMSIGGDLRLSDNNSLTSLTGLDNLTFINGNFELGYPTWYSPGGNPSLTSVEGLGSLTSIGGHLSISSNHALTSLTGMDGLTSIGGDLTINSNNTLISLTGLENIDATTIDDLIISSNSSLSTCEVQSICDYLSSQGDTIFISSNATGCNNIAEVEEACWTSVEEINTAENYSIYPNPVDDIATFSSTEIKSIELYDMMGAMLIRRNSNSIDMTNLNPGIYFVIGFDKKKLPLFKGKIIKK